MEHLLTVLMPTLPSRKRPFLNGIIDLMPSWCSLSIDSDSDISIGLKRQRMLNRVTSKYVVNIDDDDDISSEYFSEIKKGIDLDVDAIGISSVRFTNGEIDYCQKWGIKNPASFERTTILGHLCPVKTSIAKKVGYRDFGEGEDFDHMVRLQEHLHFAYYIQKVIYLNYHNNIKKEYHKHAKAPVKMHGVEPRL